MSVLIKGMKKPKSCGYCRFEDFGGCLFRVQKEDCPLIEVPPHGGLIDGDALKGAMYRDVFETDSNMYKWDADVVCWIRYTTFERVLKAAPTIIEAEKGAEDE